MSGIDGGSMSTLTAEFANKQALGDLLYEIEKTFRRYLVLGDYQCITLALYVIHTHAFEVSGQDAVGQYPYHTPYLRITSAAKRSGKTRVLEVLSLLVGRPWLCDLTTTAALVRKIQNEQPTLLLDETDRAFGGGQGLQHQADRNLERGLYPEGQCLDVRGTRL